MHQELSCSDHDKAKDLRITSESATILGKKYSESTFAEPEDGTVSAFVLEDDPETPPSTSSSSSSSSYSSKSA